MLNILSLLFLVAVMIAGIVMAIKGASAETFMGLVFLAAGILTAMMGEKYRKTPTYKDETGQDKTVGTGMLMFMYVLGAAMVVGGLYILIYGLS